MMGNVVYKWKEVKHRICDNTDGVEDQLWEL